MINRRPLGTGPVPAGNPGLPPRTDAASRAGLAAERLPTIPAAAEPPALAIENEVVEARSPGRRPLGPGGARV
ncbi:hypothetical protein OG291_03180 [Streptomyces halstedii]|uniref:hypothetical protein n=1 Tax=Streptomyces halstedii TaxID=1944 RepID=UPI0038650CCF|nr:hypothetical protein OG291_03180 [Streptomyces halstedii]